MIVVGIATAGPRSTVAVLRPGQPPLEATLAASKTLGAELAPTIKRLTAAAGLGPSRGPEAIGVLLGPGSYTGLRIGLAAAKGLAFAWSCPLIGIDTPDALLAEQSPAPARALAVLDASRGEVWVRELGPAPASEPVVGTPAEVAARLQPGPALLVGDGAALLADASRGWTAASSAQPWPSARTVAALALSRHMEGARSDSIRLAPIYFRPNEAEANRRKRSMKVG